MREHFCGWPQGRVAAARLLRCLIKLLSGGRMSKKSRSPLAVIKEELAIRRQVHDLNAVRKVPPEIANEVGHLLKQHGLFLKKAGQAGLACHQA